MVGAVNVAPERRRERLHGEKEMVRGSKLQYFMMDIFSVCPVSGC